MKHLGKLQAAVVLLVICGFFLTLAALLYVLVAGRAGDVPAGVREVLLLVIGALVSKFGDVVTFAVKARTDELLASAIPPSGGTP